MPDYIMYLRKSRADREAEARGEGETLARHETILSNLAMRNRHFIPPENIYREVVSGELISDRPEIQRVLHRILDKSVAGVYVMELERLARGDTVDQGLVSRAFKYSSTHIITPMKTFDPSNEFDEEYIDYGLHRSRGEYKTINRRIQGGRMQSVREGKFIGSRAPYGYRKYKLPREKGYSLYVHEQEAMVVRNIFDWYLHGRAGEEMGITAIAHLLHDMGIPTGDNGKSWTACRIYRMLTNEVYTGSIRWGHDKVLRELDDFEIVKRRAVTGEYNLYDGRHDPVIDLETFQAARSVLRDHGKIPVNKESKMSNPLSRIVYCSVCGHAMLGNCGTASTPPYIKCRTRDCPTVQTFREPVEKLILDTLRYWLHTCDLGGDIIIPGAQASDVSINRAAIETLTAEQKTLQKQRDNLYDLLEQGVYTKEVFTERYVTINKKLADIGESIKRNEAEIASHPTYKSPAQLAPQLRTVLEAYETAPDAKTKNDLLKTVISRIEYSKSTRGIPGVPPDQFALKIFPALT